MEVVSITSNKMVKPSEMEVLITSKQMVKPSSSKLHLLKPFKLSILDQLAPSTYTPHIFYYTKSSDYHIDTDRLKQSLSKALTQFYPLAGRSKNNMFISDYNEGVSYVETRVNGHLSDFIERNKKQEALSQLLPYRPFFFVQDSTAPLLAVQVNIFNCGGIALGLCAFHKIADAATVSAFMKSWAAFSRGSNGELPNADLLEASSRFFPPTKYADLKGLFLTERLFYHEGRFKTGSFVFDANAVSTLMLKAQSKNLERPSRVLALSAFLWKHAIMASRSVSGTAKPVVLRQPVNVRSKMKPHLSDHSIGNIYLLAMTTYSKVGEDIDLTELAYLLRESAQCVSKDSEAVRQGDKTITEQLSHIAERVLKGNVEYYTLSCWLNTLDGEDDFGWGKPDSFSIPGVDSHVRKFNKLFFLKKAKQRNAIEAWITLTEKEMSFLEHDHEFLAFASPTPYFGKAKI